MKISCSVCNKLLKEQGGLLFSPPHISIQVDKLHLCKNCYNMTLEFLTNKSFELMNKNEKNKI